MSNHKDNFFSDEKENDGSLNKFERMMRNNANYFFDVDEFEQIIEHYLINFNYQVAAQAVRIGMRQHPESLQLRYRKAQLHVINNQPQEALNMIDLLEKQMTYHPDLLYLKGSAYLQLGQFDSAILCFNELLTYPVNDPIGLLQKIGESFLIIDQLDIALIYLLKGLDKDIEDLGLLINTAYTYHLKRNFESSKYYYNLYLDEDPFDANAWIYLAVAHNELEEYHKAIEACDFAIALNDTDGNPYYNKANSLAALGEIEEAIVMYIECLKMQVDIEEDGTFSEIYCCLGECYEEINNDENAEKHYRHAIKLDANFADAWYGLSMISFRKEKTEDCMKYLKKALFLQPTNPDYWFSLGNLLAHTKEIKKAVDAFRKAIELNPEDMESWINLADMFFKNDMLTKAIKTLNESYPKTGNSPFINFRLSAYHYLKGETRLGMKYLKIALDMDFAGQSEFFKICPKAITLPEIQKLVNQYIFLL